MVKYMRGGVIRGTNAERLALSTTNLPPNTIFQETDSPNSYDLDGTSWRTRGSSGGGGPSLFDKLKTFWVTKVGSTYFIYNKDGNVAQSGTDFQVALQAQLDSMVNGDYFRFRFDTTTFKQNAPIKPPFSNQTTSIWKFVEFVGDRSVTTDNGTVFEPTSSFPTQRYSIECDTAITVDSPESQNFRCRGIHFNGRPFAKNYMNPGFNILEGTPVIEFGGIRIKQRAYSTWLDVSDCRFTYNWRGLHLIGQVWWATFDRLWFSAPSVKFEGDSCIILENGGATNFGSNPTVKGCNFTRIRGAFTPANLPTGRGTLYTDFLRMKSGAYNFFDYMFPDGVGYRTAPFNLDNSDYNIDTGFVLAGNTFNSLLELDLVSTSDTFPVPDNRVACLYLNNSGCSGNSFKNCRLPDYVYAVKIAGNANNNIIEIPGSFSSQITINDETAGPGNTIELVADWTPQWPSQVSKIITTTNGIIRIIDKRGSSSIIGILSNLNNIGLGIDYCQSVDPQGFGLLSHIQNTGGTAPTVQSDSTGSYLQYSYVINQNIGRAIGATANLQPKFTRQRNPRLTAIFQHPGAGSGRSLSIGFSSAIPTGTTGGAVGDIILANTDSGVIFGHKSTDSNFKIFHNDGTAAMITIDTGVAIDANTHVIQIWASEGGLGNKKWAYSIDTTKMAVIDSTRTPGATTAVYSHIVASRPSGSGTWRLRNWQVESK